MQAAVRPYAEIVDVLHPPYASDELVASSETPLLAIDMSGAALDDVAAGTLRALPAVTVGLYENEAVGTEPTRDGTAAFDVLFHSAPSTPTAHSANAVSWDDPDASVGRLAARVTANPEASVALVQLLRLSEGLGVVDALAAESFTYSTLQAGSEYRRWLDGHTPTSRVEVNPDPLRVERSGSLLHLTFCRPEIHNAFGWEVRDALVEALQLAAADNTIETVLLDGEGPSFCSGGDLREFGTAPDPATAHHIRTSRSAGYWIHRLADRVTARIHGSCVGSGIELPAFAAHVVTAPDLTVQLPEIGMGLVPGAGGTVSIARRIGRQRAAHLALTGERIDAPTALAWGLVDEVT
ncbi:MAG: enoyl-CoA hydratase/isomerase family protein [Actinobacteria bacterium ATB1]|nr:enoyl-CoA hydratase/isomerase family protein [Actinobacteria bacterium ATB1]